MTKTSIQWTDAVWNPVRGCSRVSAGCTNCYAMNQAHRYSGPGLPYEGLTRKKDGKVDWTGEVRTVPSKLEEPLHWRTPRRVFVNSMSDLFHPSVPTDFIAQVFAVMAIAQRHTFQILTKRPERMAKLLNDIEFDRSVFLHAQGIGGLAWHGGNAAAAQWPLPNVWLGTSIEDQAAADLRIPPLLRTPAVVRFLSCEPLLGPVNWRKIVCPCPWFEDAEVTRHHPPCPFYAIPEGSHEPMPLHWVIAGGESGHTARPMDMAWARSLRDQCKRAGVPFFFKQVGGRTSKAGGHELDGEVIQEYPGVKA